MRLPLRVESATVAPPVGRGLGAAPEGRLREHAAHERGDRERAVQEAAAPGALPTPEVAPSPGGLRVLVVEDNVDAAETLARLLRLWGHQVSLVQDGPAAIELARVERPQVVLLDIGLPGLDGYEVARRLRHELGLHEALVVAMTGYSQPGDRRRSREAGIQYHFVKPVEPVVLQKLLAAPQVGAAR